MKILVASLIAMLALITVNPAFAGTLTIGETDELLITNEGGLVLDEGAIQMPDEDNLSVPGGGYDVFIEGNLYLDYSVFSTDQDLNIGGNIALFAETLTIFSYEQEPTSPDLSTVLIFWNPYLLMHEAGDVLLFSETPIVNGRLEATGSMFVGNYSSLTPVPLPASLVLLLSGIAVCGMSRIDRNAF